MDYRSQTSKVEVAKILFDRKQYTQNYILALGIIAVIATIAFATINYALPEDNTNTVAMQVIADQQVLVQQIANKTAQLSTITDEQLRRTHIEGIYTSVEQLNTLHQSILFGNPLLGLGSKRPSTVTQIYNAPGPNLDKTMRDFILNAKMFGEFSLESTATNTNFSNKVIQLANGDLNDLLNQTRTAYKSELAKQGSIDTGLIVLLWAMLVLTLIVTGLFMLRPYGKKVINAFESLKKSRYQLLAVKKTIEVEKENLINELDKQKALVDNAPIASLIYFFETDELKWNAPFLELTGISAENSELLKGESFQLKFEDVIRNYTELAASFFSFLPTLEKSKTHKLAMKNGTYLESTSELLRVNNRITAKMWQFSDITSHIVLAKRFSDRSKTLEKIIEKLDDAVVAINAEGQLTHYNNAALTMLELNSANLNSNEWYTNLPLVPTEDNADEKLPFLSTTLGLEFDNFQLLSNNNDKRINISAKGGPIKDKNGNITGGVIIMRQDQKIGKSKDIASVDQVLESVAEGVFFIDESLKILPKKSVSLEKLLGKDISNLEKADELFENLVSQNLTSVIKDYIKLIFHSVVTESFVDELNPIHEIEVDIDDPDEGWITRHLSFNFARMFQSESVQSVMITVRDITDQVKEVKKIKKSQSRIQRQIDLLFRVIHVDPSLLESFVQECAVEIANIHLLLQRDGFNDNLKENLNKILRKLVNIRESASFLDLQVFEEKAIGFEKLILFFNENLALNDHEMEKLNVHLTDLHETLDEVKHIIDNLITKLKVKFRGKREEECRRFTSSLEGYVQRLSREAGKKVFVDTGKFNAIEIPYADRQHVREIISAVATTLVHSSIETPNERRALGKTPNAVIEIQSGNGSEENYEFVIRDDGNGITQNVPEMVAVSKNGAEYYAESETDSDATGLILDKQFFAEYNQSAISNIAPGLGKIETQISKMGGKINAFTQNGEFNEFYISIPRKKQTIQDIRPIIVSGKKKPIS